MEFVNLVNKMMGFVPVSWRRSIAKEKNKTIFHREMNVYV